MLNWIDINIEIFNKSDHILLIKPHVAETFYPNSKSPNQNLKNYLKNKKMNKNIILLDSDLFLSSEIIKIVDCSIIWRSTAYVENIALMHPSIFCGPSSAYGDCLNIDRFENINEYKMKLFNKPNKKISKSDSLQAKSLLYYLNLVCITEADIHSNLGIRFNNNIIINPFKLLKFIKNENSQLKNINF